MEYKPMRIAVLNLSGNVGKSTLAAQMLKAYRPNAKLLSVEPTNNNDSLNVADFEVEELKASQFKDIYRELMLNDDVILDVGASSIVQFMDELTKYRSAIGEFDLIVVPTVPVEKQQKDTYATIEWLNKLGVPGEKIRVVFNQYTGADTIAATYPHVFGYAESDGKKKATWAPHPIVAANEAFEIATQRETTIRALAADKTDWKAAREAAKAAKDMNALESAMDGQIAHDLAMTAIANLEQAYEDLLAPYIKAAKK
ncbi:MAG TPA: StbB family protein [Noviherbaspirillum sp.]|nr:StbB family protein [Noviherbaspirillum sp.]